MRAGKGSVKLDSSIEIASWSGWLAAGGCAAARVGKQKITQQTTRSNNFPARVDLLRGKFFILVLRLRLPFPHSNHTSVPERSQPVAEGQKFFRRPRVVKILMARINIINWTEMLQWDKQEGYAPAFYGAAPGSSCPQSSWRGPKPEEASF